MVFWVRNMVGTRRSYLTPLVARVLFSFSILLTFSGCSLFKLDKDSNCLNDKSTCFKADKTAPRISSSAPDINAQYAVLDYIDLTFSEEVKNGESADAYSLSGSGFTTGYKIQYAQKVAQYTYRVFLGGGSLQTGNIDLSFAGIVDYAGNAVTGQTTVSYQGSSNVPITVSVKYSGTVVNGVSNNGGGAYSNVDISFSHQFTADNANNYSIYLTTGGTVCSGTLIGSSTNLAANTFITPINKLATFFPLGLNRIVVCVTNQNNPTATGVASWALIRDDSPPTMTNSVPPDNYPTPQNITLACSDNMDKIAYTVATQQGSAPTPPVDPGFDATGNLNATSTLYAGALNAGNPANPTYTIFSWQCIDKSGNRSALTASVTKNMQYYIDSTIPAVNLANDSTFRAYIGPVNTSSTLKFTTDQSNKTYNIRRNGTTCTGGGDGTLLATGTTPATAGTVISQTFTTGTHFTTADTVYPVRICVAGPTSVWGTAFLQITRDDTAPVITPTVVAGTYGAVQNVVFNCTDTNLDNAVYRYTTQLGKVAPGAPTAPTFNTATGAVTSPAPNYSGPFSTPDSSTSVAMYGCIDLAGNQASGGPVQYTVDSTIPAVTLVSIDHVGVTTNVGGYNSVNITWNTSRAGVGYSPATNFDIRISANCTSGTILTTGLSSATAGANNVTNIPAASFPAGANALKICVQNYAGNYGYQTTALTVTRDDTAPTFAGFSGIASAGSGSYTLSWAAATDSGSGPAFYRIYQSNTSLTYGTTPDYTVAAPNTSFTVNGLTPGTIYYFVAGAVDNAGNETKVVTLAGEVRTRFNLIVNVSGKTASTNPFVVRSGSDVLTFTTTGSQTFATGFLPATSYSVSIQGQPENQNCAFIQDQYGTINSDLTLNVTCVAGYINSGNMTVNPAVPLNYNLYRGNAQAIAGSGSPGVTDNTGLTAQFNNPHGMTYVNGNIYIAEQTNHRIRRLNLSTNAVTTLAGSTQGTNDGTGVSAQFSIPQGITTDGANLYVADSGSGRIRRIVIATGAVSTIAGAGSGGGTTCPGTVTTGCLDGIGQQATFVGPNDITYNNGYLYISEYTGSRVRRMDLSTGQIITIAGDGSASGSADGNGTSATFINVTGGAIIGNDLYVADFNGNKIRKINLTSPYAVSTVAGSSVGYADGPASTAKFYGPDHFTTDGTNLFIGEYNGNRIRRFDTRTNIVSTLAGDGTAANLAGVGVAAQFNQPVGVVSDGAKLYVAAWAGNQVFRISDSGLVAYWPLNGTPTDYNSSGSAVNNLTPAGGLTTTTGRYGSTDVAYRFDGTASLATAANPPSLSLSSEYTISAWVYPNSTAGMRIVDKITSGGCDGYLVDFMPGNQVRFSYCIGGSGEVRSGALVPTGQWTHIAAAFSSSRKRARIYINGRLDAEVQTVAGTTQTNALPVRIGVDSAGNYKFSGAMAAVRLYDRLLSEGEINELAQDAGGTASVGSGYSTGATGLLAHFDYTNTSAASLGPIGGTMTPLCSNPIGKDGDAGGSCYLDGSTNMSANGKSIGAPGGNAPRTLCIWFKPASLPVNKVLLAHGNPNAPVQRGFGMTLLSSTQAQLWSWGGPTVTFNYNVQLNTWQHLCGTLSGSTVQMYANGQLIGTDTGTISAANTVNDTGSVLSMGSNLDGNASLIFNGTLDDARIYNNVLTAGQIRQLATQVPAGLVLHLDMNGDATDVSGAGQNLVSNSGSPAPGRTGVTNTAYRFTNGQLITISDRAELNPSMDASWTFWMKSPSVSSLSTEIFGKYTGVNGWIFKYDQTNFMHGWTYASTATGAQTNSYPVPSDNVWNHYAFVRSGSTMTIYLNGASMSNVQVGNGLALLPGNVNLKFGNFGVGDLTAQDARLYSRALSAAEVRSLSGYSPQQVTTWNPSPAASSLKLQLAADSLSNLAGGASVATWFDTSGQGNHVTAPGTQPVFQTNAFGNASGVRFSSSLMNRTTSLTGFNTTLDSTFFIVLARSSTVTHHLLNVGLNVGGCNSNRQYLLYGPSPNSHIDIEHEGCNGNSSNSFPTTTNAELHSIMVDSSSNMNFYMNGAANGGNNPGWGGFSAPNVLTIGGIPSSPTGTLAGTVGEILYFNTPLAATSVYSTVVSDRQIVECYLSAKYSIALASTLVCP